LWHCASTTSYSGNGLFIPSLNVHASFPSLVPRRLRCKSMLGGDDVFVGPLHFTPSFALVYEMDGRVVNKGQDFSSFRSCNLNSGLTEAITHKTPIMSGHVLLNNTLQALNAPKPVPYLQSQVTIDTPGCRLTHSSIPLYHPSHASPDYLLVARAQDDETTEEKDREDVPSDRARGVIVHLEKEEGSKPRMIDRSIGRFAWFAVYVCRGRWFSGRIVPLKPTTLRAPLPIVCSSSLCSTQAGW
jgi:hypothetical protein